MRKLIVIIVFLVLVRCTVSLVLVKNSEDVEVRQGTDSGLSTEAEVDLSKTKDTIK